jgi:hypothetical protein
MGLFGDLVPIEWQSRRPRPRPGVPSAAYASSVSRFWDRAFRVFYWIIATLGPLLRPVVERVELGNLVELILPGRRTGKQRVVLLGLLRVESGWYLGHPNGAANWTRNLDAAGAGGAAGAAALRFPGRQPLPITAELLPLGDERRRVILRTWHQHVFPGTILYWLARKHIFAVGRYYRIELAT